MTLPKSPQCQLSHSHRTTAASTGIYRALFVNETDLHLNPPQHKPMSVKSLHNSRSAPVASHMSPFYLVAQSGEQFELLAAGIQNHIQCYHPDWMGSPGWGDTLFLGSKRMLSPRVCERWSAVILWKHLSAKMLIRQRCVSHRGIKTIFTAIQVRVNASAPAPFWH